MATVAIIGGGITGLSAAHYLEKLKQDQNLELDLVLIEGEAQLGGKIRTVDNGEFIMETGADSIVARHASVLELVGELGLQERVVYNGTGISYLYANNKLHAIPADSVFGIPMDKEALFSSTLVSEQGKLEALKDFESTNETFTRNSSLGEFLKAFLGEELVEKQIGPVLSGVYSGSLDDLTLATTLPYLVDYKNDYGSIIKGFEANKAHFQGAANKKFISFDKGMAVLIDRLEETLHTTTIVKEDPVSTIVKQGDGYVIELAGGHVIGANFVVFATPHQVAQQVLGLEELDEEFQKLTNSSLISVYLGFDIADENLPKDGTGFIVSEGSDVLCNACTWTSRKWSHTSRGQLLVRLFYKSSNPAYEGLTALSEEELVKVALSDIRKSLQIEAQPTTVEVTDWKGLMPNYHMAHKAAVDALEMKMAAVVPNVHLAGSSYYGVGIGACIQNGKEVAQAIATELKQHD
ncbi:oxygen-dependent protoporphyrinogen oxidase [Planomicrobium koreense]|uniref:Coproporphyrinogen III oxidase n=1 Tax=Planococcus koreensis TaxID=112331 RepID=A0A7W8FTR4_9BACL|nr:protoporphyrinogen oxidase [Planococcus koreensis]MBB5181328.1 oxygen-dependent protoporphyrinogen oxidase [Planococcus koreensis]